MCRWIAYVGKPIYIDMLVTKPPYSLVEQSLNAKMLFRNDGSLLATNGDGFGIGWYMDKEEPGLFKGAEPAWGNENLNEICSQVKARVFMAHIRAASTGSIQRSNAHPFKYKNWLFQHNGYLSHFESVRRELQCLIDPSLFPTLQGTTDSETFFLLALTYGLQSDPKAALREMLTQVMRVCDAKGIPADIILSCALSDGKTLYTIRYASGGKPHSQYYSTHASCMLEINGSSCLVPDRSVVVVSEPLDQSGEHWTEMPHNAFATISQGEVAVEPFYI